MAEEKKILIFTENFGKRILAEGMQNITNLETFLNNNTNKNRIILKGVESYYRDEYGNYKPKDHKRGSQILNVNHIDFVYGDKSLVYANNLIGVSSEASVLWGMKNLHHSLIGEVRVPGNQVPRIKKGASIEKIEEIETELITYLDKQFQKNFISLYDPRSDSADAKKEFGRLFHGLKMHAKDVKRILINNKKQSLSNTSQAIYLGKSSKNFE